MTGVPLHMKPLKLTTLLASHTDKVNFSSVMLTELAYFLVQSGQLFLGRVLIARLAEKLRDISIRWK